MTILAQAQTTALLLRIAKVEPAPVEVCALKLCKRCGRAEDTPFGLWDGEPCLCCLIEMEDKLCAE